MNGTVAGVSKDVGEYKTKTAEMLGVGEEEVDWKESKGCKCVFDGLSVKICEEIVPMGKPHVLDLEKGGQVCCFLFYHCHFVIIINIKQHLNPKDWHKKIESDDNAVLLDTRNYYEVDVGKFQADNREVLFFSFFR